MPLFSYRAVSAEGKLVQGSVEAMNRLAAAGQLQERRLVPLAVHSPNESSLAWRPWAGLSFRPQRLAQHREVFARTLSSLLSAGIPMDRSLTLTEELTDSRVLREALGQVLRSVRGGKSLSAAMEIQPQAFPPFYVSMARAGEASGNLADTFLRLAEYQQSANKLRSQLSSAMIYPTLLLVVGSASVMFLLQFVVPKFAVVFEEAGAALPLPTAILLGVSRYFRATWWLWLVGLPALFVILGPSLRRGRGRQWLDRVSLTLPKVGAVLERVLVARFTRSLGILLRGGVPIVRALEISGQVLGNQKLAQAVRQAAQGVKQGRGLAGPLRATGTFPELSLHMIGVGEETGQLDSMLLHVAEVYERESEMAIRSLVALFEPLMILGIGLVIGGVVISILLAVFSINQIPM